MMITLPTGLENVETDFVTLGKNFLKKIANKAGMKIIFARKRLISNTGISIASPNNSLIKSGKVSGMIVDVRTMKTVDHKICKFKKLASSGVAIAPETASNIK